MEPVSLAQSAQNRASLLELSQALMPRSRCTGTLFSQLLSVADHLCLYEIVIYICCVIFIV